MSKIKKTYCNKYEIIEELGESGNAKVISNNQGYLFPVRCET